MIATHFGVLARGKPLGSLMAFLSFGGHCRVCHTLLEITITQSTIITQIYKPARARKTMALQGRHKNVEGKLNFLQVSMMSFLCDSQSIVRLENVCVRRNANAIPVSRQ